MEGTTIIDKNWKSLTKPNKLQIESLLSGKADADVSNYSINNRSLTKMSVAELIQFRDYYKAEYLREIRIQRNKSGQGSGSNILVNFK